MTIEEIIKEAFSQGWNASHECATDFDYEYALKNCLSELDSEVKKLNIPAVIKSVCEFGLNPDNCIRKADTCFKCLPIK